MKRFLATLALLAVTSTLTLPAAAESPKNQEVDPDTLRIVWGDEAHRDPSFIPQALIGDLDLTSPETVDLSHLPMTDSQKYSFKFFLFAEPDGPDGCFLPHIAGRVAVKGWKPLGLSELLARKPLATTGVVRKIVPGWLTGIAMAGNLVFVEVDEPLRDTDQVTTAGQPLLFIQTSGAELVISGKRICSPKNSDYQVRVGSQVLLFGVADGRNVGGIIGRVFEIRDSVVYPTPQIELRKEAGPIPLWELRRQMEKFAELER